MRLPLSVLPGRQWLDVLPGTWISVSVEVLLLQYSFATGHFRLGVSCMVPGTSKQGPYQDRPPLCPFRLLPLLIYSGSVIAFLKFQRVQSPKI